MTTASPNFSEDDMKPPDRSAFEKWLSDSQGLDGDWDAVRNCYTEFAVHVAWKAWIYGTEFAAQQMGEGVNPADGSIASMASAAAAGNAEPRVKKGVAYMCPGTGDECPLVELMKIGNTAEPALPSTPISEINIGKHIHCPDENRVCQFGMDEVCPKIAPPSAPIRSEAIYESAHHCNIPADAIDRFIGTLRMVGFDVLPHDVTQQSPSTQTPETDSTFERTAYQVEDDYQGKVTQYDIGRIKGDMRTIERDRNRLAAELAAKDAEIAALREHKPLTYLAAPYSHPDRAVRVERFDLINKAAVELMSKGELVYSPISHTHPIAEAGSLPLGWEFWQKYDTAFIEHSKRVVVLKLDGWRESKGVTAEILIATKLGTPIEYIVARASGAAGKV